MRARQVSSIGQVSCTRRAGKPATDARHRQAAPTGMRHALRRSYIPLGVLLSALLNTAPVRAQQNTVGVWVSAGAGLGWNTSKGAGTGARGFSYNGRGGLTLGNRFGFGAELARWWTSIGSDTNTTNLMVIGTVRPAAYPVFLKAGLGWARAPLLSPSTTALNTRDGFAFTLGLSAEAPAVGPLRVAANVDWLVQMFGALADFPKVNNFLAVTVGLTYRNTAMD